MLLVHFGYFLGWVCLTFDLTGVVSCWWFCFLVFVVSSGVDCFGCWPVASVKCFVVDVFGGWGVCFFMTCQTAPPKYIRPYYRKTVVRTPKWSPYHIFGRGVSGGFSWLDIFKSNGRNVFYIFLYKLYNYHCFTIQQKTDGMDLVRLLLKEDSQHRHDEHWSCEGIRALTAVGMNAFVVGKEPFYTCPIAVRVKRSSLKNTKLTRSR